MWCKRTISLVGVVLFAGAVVSVDADEATLDTRFYWEAPAALAGDLVVRFSYTPLEEADCSHKFTASGHHDRNGASGLFTRDDYGVLFGGTTPFALQVHAEDIDTRNVVGPGDSWQHSISGTYSDVSETREWVVMGANLGSNSGTPPAESPFTIEVDCGDVSITVGAFAGSRELVAFTQDTMNGSGASTFPGPSVQIGDRVQGTFASPEVYTGVTWVPFIGVMHNGTLVHEHPDGSESYEMPGNIFVLDDFRGPGAFAIEIDRVYIGFADFLSGVIAGLGPVDTLDQLV